MEHGLLGTGSFGKVCLVSSFSHQHVAAKMVKVLMHSSPSLPPFMSPQQALCMLTKAPFMRMDSHQLVSSLQGS